MLNDQSFDDRVRNGHYSVAMWRQRHAFPVSEERVTLVQTALDKQFEEDLLAHLSRHTRMVDVGAPEYEVRQAAQRMVPRRKKNEPVAATEPASDGLDNGFASWARVMLAETQVAVTQRQRCQSIAQYQMDVAYEFYRRLEAYVKAERLKRLAPDASLEEKIAVGYYDSEEHRDEFKTDLLKAHGVERHPKAKKVYDAACERADGEGHERIAMEFASLVELLG